MRPPPPSPDDAGPSLPPALRRAGCLLTVGATMACGHVTVPDRGGDDVQPPEAGWVTAAAGDSHTCGLAASGSVFCWGSDGRGQLGIGAGAPADSAPDTGDCAEPCVLHPRPVEAAASFDTVVAGRAHSCGLAASGRAFCWGGNDRGQLGDSTRVDRPLPTPVAADLSFAALTAGGAHTCGITRGERHLYCWGDNFWGQMGRGTRSTAAVRVPVFVLRSVRTADAGADHTCAVTSVEGVLACWGRNQWGQLGVGYRSDFPETRPVVVLASATAVSAGLRHTCGLAPRDGTAICWGWNDEGAVGTGSESGYELDPRLVSGSLSYRALSAGGGHTCALGAGGGLHCWGDDLSGQVGVGRPGGFVTEPEPVEPERSFRSLSAGGGRPLELADSPPDDLDDLRFSAHTCAVDAGGALFCWGSNGHGELGDGTQIDRGSPFPVPPPGG